MREGDVPPRTPAETARRAQQIRRRMRAAEGEALLPKENQAPLDAQVLGVLERDGYRVERLVFQTRPGCCATANTYVPAGKKGPFPAVLCVHGHWAGARRDPVVQARCIGLAKLGFFVLTLDAWGAGERGTRPGQNEYHGGLLGASLWPVGTPLHGLQLNDNVRALDYLQSRPEVDGSRIGCTGASGGGNQTTQISAFDERIRCAVPVCSVGTFASYLDTASCVDEVLDGALAFAEEGDLLGMVAPRALMVITASQDSYHFGPKASAEALERARPYFQSHGAEERVRHVVIESGHAYSQPMREAMYGWMSRWLKGEGDGSPIAEPPVKLEDPEALRCFDPPARPEKVMTTVRWVRERAREMADAVKLPERASAWAKERDERLGQLRDALRLPEASVPKSVGDPIQNSRFEPEPGVLIPEHGGPATKAVMLLHPLGMKAALETPLAKELEKAGVSLRSLELRGCGDLTLPGQGLSAEIPDHNLVEWSLWIGRPLLGQWVHDIRQAMALGRSAQAPQRWVLLGWREAGLAALLAAALEKDARGVAAVETLATFTGEGPPHNQRMAVFNPDLLKVGNIPHLAALSAPRPALIANPVRLDGMAATDADLASLYRWPKELYQVLGHGERFAARREVTDSELAETVQGWLR